MPASPAPAAERSARHGHVLGAGLKEDGSNAAGDHFQRRLLVHGVPGKVLTSDQHNSRTPIANLHNNQNTILLRQGRKKEQGGKLSRLVPIHTAGRYSTHTLTHTLTRARAHLSKDVVSGAAVRREGAPDARVEAEVDGGVGHKGGHRSPTVVQVLRIHVRIPPPGDTSSLVGMGRV